MRGDKFEITVRGDLGIASRVCKEIGEVFGRYENMRIKRRFDFDYKTDELKMRFVMRVIPDEDEPGEE